MIGERVSLPNRQSIVRIPMRWKRCAQLIATFGVAAVGLGSIVHGADQVSGLITRTYVIVEDTDLTGDVVCDVGSNPCFSFGASDVELRLNGYTITGKADPVTGCGGATFTNEFGVTTGNRSGVIVRGPGLIQRFRNHGIFVTGSTNARVEQLTASTNCGSGVLVAANSFGTLVEGTTSVRNGAGAGSCGGI
jgi:hypothetical protein